MSVWTITCLSGGPEILTGCLVDSTAFQAVQAVGNTSRLQHSVAPATSQQCVHDHFSRVSPADAGGGTGPTRTRLAPDALVIEGRKWVSLILTVTARAAAYPGTLAACPGTWRRGSSPPCSRDPATPWPAARSPAASAPALGRCAPPDCRCQLLASAAWRCLQMHKGTNFKCVLRTAEGGCM
jgi:hypothetical protein